MLKVSVVSYLNSLPFIYGLKHSDFKNKFEINLNIPSESANNFLLEKVDIALVPVALLPQLEDYKIISDYCIGADGNVGSVYLFSNFPLKEIKQIHLDFHSLTSINLVKILAEKYWEISPEWHKINASDNNETFYDSAVLIGDKTFEAKSKYKYAYDLAEEWKKFTALPFVFACWISTKNISQDDINIFNSALKFGINNIQAVVKENYHRYNMTEKEVNTYLTENIKYIMDSDFKKSMDKFISML